MRHKWIPASTYTYTCVNPGCRLEMQKSARYRLVGTTGSFKEGYFPCPTSKAPATDRASAFHEVLIIMEEIRTSMGQEVAEPARFVLDRVKTVVEQKLAHCAHEVPIPNTADEDDPI